MHTRVEEIGDPGEAVDLQRVLLDRRLARQSQPGLPADQLVRMLERGAGMLGREKAAEVVDPEQHRQQRDLPEYPPDSAVVLQLRLPHPFQRRLRHAAPKLKPNVRSFQTIAIC
ncbi:hypothetical protein GCM10009742_21960 [Kribbella karoonensis]|uniref:Uncharacterized protein n=1 Tax=Kribbella karoonensis TaxID=324851 RepID=A0ABN2DKV9_9ACTN